MICALAGVKESLRAPKAGPEHPLVRVHLGEIRGPSGPEVLDSSQSQNSFAGVSGRGGARLPPRPAVPTLRRRAKASGS